LALAGDSDGLGKRETANKEIKQETMRECKKRIDGGSKRPTKKEEK
jgi:hypothetical protein